jgi:lysyl-tRNA synthetase class 1
MSEEAEHHAFWADEFADRVASREPTEPVVVKGGVSPSGVPHVGHLNEIMRGYYVAAALRDRGYEVRQVFTADDRDPLRKVPRTLADADGNLVDLGDAPDPAAVGQNLGRPYTAIPDPFGCHDSYGDHFTALLADAAAAVDIPVEFVSNTDLYESGAFDDVVRTLLADTDAARELLTGYQDSIGEDYVPFRPICEACGLVTEGVTDIDLDAGEVSYECQDIEAGNQTIEGCGHRGTASFRDGKLPWRFEWPAQWHALDVDFEPFGKDHAEGSWESGAEIAEQLLGDTPPVPMVYEWFTLDGAALSSSSGHVATVQELLELVEVEVLRYFFALSPRKSRDLDLERIDRLVDDFDRFERLYFQEETDRDRGPFARRAYPFVIDPGRFSPELTAAAAAAADLEPDAIAALPETGDFATLRSVLDETVRDRARLPYTFAAVLGMTDDRELRIEMARNEEHLHTDAPDWAVTWALERVPKARTWAQREDNAYNYRLQAELPTTDFDEATVTALEELADTVAAGADGETIQGEIYEVARRHDIEPPALFRAGYRLFFDETQGPRLGEFLAELDREFVVARLRREA